MTIALLPDDLLTIALLPDDLLTIALLPDDLMTIALLFVEWHDMSSLPSLLSSPLYQVLRRSWRYLWTAKDTTLSA